MYTLGVALATGSDRQAEVQQRRRAEGSDLFELVDPALVATAFELCV